MSTEPSSCWRAWRSAFGRKWNFGPFYFQPGAARISQHPGKPFPADIGKNPFTGVFVLLPPERNPVMRGIILWLLGVPLVVIIGLYLFHVI